MRRSNVHGATATNTVVRSLFMRSAEVGRTMRLRSAPRSVTVAIRSGIAAGERVVVKGGILLND